LPTVSARRKPRPPNSFRPSSLVPRPVLSRWLRKQSLLKQANLEVASCVLSVQRKALTLNAQPKLKPFTTRHSLFATRRRFRLEVQLNSLS
jgi:hypothetical protein